MAKNFRSNLVSYYGEWGTTVEISTIFHRHCTDTGMNIDIYAGPYLITKEFLTGFFTQDGKIDLNKLSEAFERGKNFVFPS